MATTAAESVGAALAEAARAVLATAGPSVVRIGRHGGRGCGVVVAEGAVLTNAHNLRDRTTEVTFAGGRAEQGSVAAADVDGDLVVVRGRHRRRAAVGLGRGPAGRGRASSTRWPARPGDGTRITVGMLSSVDGAFRGPRGRRVSGTLEHTAPLARGSSGSPLLDDEGRLLGLNTARLGQGFYVALPADADLRSPRRRAAPRRVATAAHARHRAGARARSPPACGHRSACPSATACSCARSIPRAPRPRPASRSAISWPGPAAGRCATVDDLHGAIDGAGDDAGAAARARRRGAHGDGHVPGRHRPTVLTGCGSGRRPASTDRSARRAARTGDGRPCRCGRSA